jgi:hypothetical protein
VLRTRTFVQHRHHVAWLQESADQELHSPGAAERAAATAGSETAI